MRIGDPKLLIFTFFDPKIKGGFEPRTPEMIFHVFGLKWKVGGVSDSASRSDFSHGLIFLDFNLYGLQNQEKAHRGLEPRTPLMIFHVFGLKWKVGGVSDSASRSDFSHNLIFLNFIL